MRDVNEIFDLRVLRAEFHVQVVQAVRTWVCLQFHFPFPSFFTSLFPVEHDCCLPFQRILQQYIYASSVWKTCLKAPWSYLALASLCLQRPVFLLNILEHLYFLIILPETTLCIDFTFCASVFIFVALMLCASTFPSKSGFLIFCFCSWVKLASSIRASVCFLGVFCFLFVSLLLAAAFIRSTVR